MAIFEEELEDFRKELGLSQSVFGKIMGINDKTYRSRLKLSPPFNRAELKLLSKYIIDEGISISFERHKAVSIRLRPFLNVYMKSAYLSKAWEEDDLEKQDSLDTRGECRSDATTNVTSETINIKYLANTFGSMGEGGVSYEELPSVMSFDKEFLVNIIGLTEFKNVFIINAMGDSMCPSIKDGSKLFINPFENENCIIVNGDVYVIYSPQLGYIVKRVARESFDGSITLKSDNKDYKDIVMPPEHLEECQILGRVVGNFKGRV